MSTKTPSLRRASAPSRPQRRSTSVRLALNSTQSIASSGDSAGGALRFVYEAGPCGFWLQRYLRSVGQSCEVAAPSLIPRRPGVRIKTDRLDARNLALALRAGTLTAVHVPTPEEEAFRDVVRAWQQSKRDVTAAKQRLKGFLLRNDIRYEGRASWSAAHRRWLARLVLPSTAQQNWRTCATALLLTANAAHQRRGKVARVLRFAKRVTL
jgi:transposase